ncbi:NAD-dependent deacetylase sirtuin-2 [Xylariaceae sp. FL0662B]|nr:NAD-dependent deacetylase sirtuin-2 [Xylariaceae sp. FL0662B]
MGQEQSCLIDETVPPQTLSERSLKAVAEYIKNGHAKRIVVMTGAGISTAAGIPDFRSPKTGLYHNLARLDLPYPEAVFEIEFFRENPAPFYYLAKELYPGNFSPTISHVFAALLATKGLLHMLFTQNIDCLERAAGVPASKIVEAHGSFATQRCIDCRTEYPDEAMRENVARGDPPECVRPECGGLVKPDIVFFGEQLPNSFYQNMPAVRTTDLVLVLGTSLMVQPFASLPRMATDSVPRVLFNLDRVGDLGTRLDDVLCLGDCDSGVRKLADELGWRDELEEMWVDIVGETEAKRQRAGAEKKEAAIEDELEKLVGEVEHKLEISESATNTYTGANLSQQEEGTGRPQQGPPTDSAPGPTAGTAGVGTPKRVDEGPPGVDETKDQEAPPPSKTGPPEESQQDGDSTLEKVANLTPAQPTNEEAGKADEAKPISEAKNEVGENKPAI